MRWATSAFDRVWTIAEQLMNSTPANLPNSIQPFIQHDVISSASLRAKVSIVKGAVHNEVMRISGISCRWDFKIMQVLMRSEAQAGDIDLMNRWKWQIQKMKELEWIDFGSTKAGDFDRLMPVDQVRRDIIPQGYLFGGPEEPEHPEEEDDASAPGEEDWELRIDQGMLQNVFDVVGNELEEPN
ncbi:uncharacterized protein MELLADRAFT_61717 [Melampsora larici-populina 98AG31]|uniref:Uncharacterized protein n=1 Tax=Melampsora larici-populina (strain 98AG31 / pathotype 3-4-7) TaxID=747676 RepID=F4RGA7_MELLP|nr:uncharacterized protein MELLADRAFT_61717 [Melampsora larici-populina 98AG31]EGG08697.1 hypothetical protein MELLADRAFT_61717 [Melampsora larici-populina 98AG31]